LMVPPRRLEQSLDIVDPRDRHAARGANCAVLGCGPTFLPVHGHHAETLRPLGSRAARHPRSEARKMVQLARCPCAEKGNPTIAPPINVLYRGLMGWATPRYEGIKAHRIWD